jgi:hypothetical protein
MDVVIPPDWAVETHCQSKLADLMLMLMLGRRPHPDALKDRNSRRAQFGIQPK